MELIPAHLTTQQDLTYLSCLIVYQKNKKFRNQFEYLKYEGTKTNAHTHSYSKPNPLNLFYS